MTKWEIGFWHQFTMESLITLYAPMLPPLHLYVKNYLISHNLDISQKSTLGEYIVHHCANLWLKFQNTNGCKSLLNKFDIWKIDT